MKSGYLLRLALFVALLPAPAAQAAQLGGAYKKAQEIVRDSKTSSSPERDRARNERISELGPTESASPSEREIERQRREADRQRIRKNAEVIAAERARAAARPRKVAPREPGPDSATIAARHRQIDALVDAEDSAQALRISAQMKEKALEDYNAIRAAMTAGERPPFRQLWDFYKYNRPIGLGLVPEQNRCAIVMSMTLGLEPGSGEKSLASLGNRGLVDSLEGPMKTMLVARVYDSQFASRYYISAQQMADRLVREFGPPLVLKGKQVRPGIADRRGIIFVQNAYFRFPRGWRGDHIDVWDRNRIGATATSTPFEWADQVLFWELQ